MAELLALALLPGDEDAFARRGAGLSPKRLGGRARYLGLPYAPLWRTRRLTLAPSADRAGAPLRASSMTRSASVGVGHAPAPMRALAACRASSLPPVRKWSVRTTSGTPRRNLRNWTKKLMGRLCCKRAQGTCGPVSCERLLKLAPLDQDRLD